MRLYSPATEIEQREALASFGLNDSDNEQNQQENLPWHCVCCEPAPTTGKYTSGMHPDCRQEFYPRRGGAR